MTITCPECKCELDIQRMATLPDDSRLSVTMQSTTNAFPADTVADMMLNTVRGLQACANAIGRNVAVFLEKIEVNGGTVTFDLQVVSVKEPTP